MKPNPLYNPAFSPFAGIRIVINAHHPQVFDRWEERRYPAHPLVAWIYRALNRVFRLSLEPDIVVRVPRYRDSDMIFDRARGVIYCSPRQAAELKHAAWAKGAGA